MIARWASLEHRAAVRALLADPDMKVRCAAARGLVGDRYRRPDVSPNPEDKKLLADSRMKIDPASLTTYLRSRTLSVEQYQALMHRISDLESNVYITRKDAAEKITAVGRSALPFLAEALARRQQPRHDPPPGGV